MRRVFWLLALLLALAVPCASAQSDRMTAAVGHKRLEVTVGEVLSDAESDDLREELDTNNDDSVSASEVQAHQRDHSRTFSGSVNPLCFGSFSFVRIDGDPPERLAEVREQLTAADGPVDAERSIYQQTTFVFAYPNDDADPRVTVEYGRLRESYAAVMCSTVSWMGMQDWDAWGWDQWSTISGFEASEADDEGAYESGSASEDPEDVFEVVPLSDYHIDFDSLKPTAARNLWDGRGVVADTDPEQEALAQSIVTFTIVGGPDEGWGMWATTAAVVGVAGTATAAAGGVAVATTEFGRYKFLKLLAAVPLFSRFEKDDVLEHGTREQLYQYIRQNPGPSFSDLRRALELSNGTLVHHLRILEMQEFVKPVRDGFRTRFYIRGPRVIPSTYLTRTQLGILEAIQSNPGVTQKELAQILGLPRESVFYHARKLETAGKLKVAKEGKWRRYFPAAEAAAPAAPVQTPGPV